MAALTVADRLDEVRHRMARACARSGRPEDVVRLVAVSKKIPLPLMVEACGAGQWDLGKTASRRPWTGRLNWPCF